MLDEKGQFVDEQIECVECGKAFTFTVAEQEFYEARGFSKPKRCKPCRQRRKAERAAKEE